MKVKLAIGVIRRYWKPILCAVLILIFLGITVMVSLLNSVVSVFASPLLFFSDSKGNDQAQLEVIETYKSIGTTYNLHWPDLAAYDTIRTDGDLEQISKKSIEETLETFSYYTEVCTEVTNSEGTTQQSCTKQRSFYPLETVMKNHGYDNEEMEYARLISENLLDYGDYEVSNIPGGSVVIDPELIKNEAFIWPVPSVGTITSSFYQRVNPVTGESEFHKGIDISNGKSGVPIVATADGTIIYWSDDSSSTAGKWIRIQHADGYQSRYLHMSRLAVQETTDGKPTEVKKGQVIGYIGSTGQSTGPHLHFEMRKDGELLNPIILVGKSRPE